MGLDSCWKLADGGGCGRPGKSDVVGVAFRGYGVRLCVQCIL